MRKRFKSSQSGAIFPLFAILLSVIVTFIGLVVTIGIISNSKTQLMYAASIAARTALNEFHASSGSTLTKAQLARDRANPFFTANAKLLGYFSSNRSDPGTLGLSNEPPANREGGTLRFGNWFTQRACPTCSDPCSGNYPCFAEVPLNNANATVDAVQVTAELTQANSFLNFLASALGNSYFETEVTATSVIQPRCYEVLIDASNSMVNDNYRPSVTSVVPKATDPLWGGPFSAYSFSDSSKRFGDFLYDRNISGHGKSISAPVSDDTYPEYTDCSDMNGQAWTEFLQYFEENGFEPPSTSARGEMSYIWCWMRTFRGIRNNANSREHFASDYRPITANFGTGSNKTYWVDAYMVSEGRGPEPFRTVLHSVHNLIKTITNYGFGSDYLMLRSFGTNIRPSIEGLYTRDQFPYLLQVTNIENGPVVGSDGSEELPIYPNFGTIGLLPDEENAFSNLYLPLYQAVEDLTRDPALPPPSPTTSACPANAIKRIIIASDFIPNCSEDGLDAGPGNGYVAHCPYTGGGTPLYRCFRRIPVGSGYTYCSNTYDGWNWLNFATTAGSEHPTGLNPYTNSQWSWSTNYFSGNKTNLANIFQTTGISVMTIMAGNSVGPNWTNHVNPNAGAQGYQWMDFDMWRIRQSINPASPPSLDQIAGNGELGIVNAAGYSTEWNRMMAGQTGSPADIENYRPFSRPNAFAAWLAVVTNGDFCPLRPVDTRAGNCTPDDKFFPGDSSRQIHCDSIAPGNSGCRGTWAQAFAPPWGYGNTNCNAHPEICWEWFDHQCKEPSARLLECISRFTQLPIALVEKPD